MNKILHKIMIVATTLVVAVSIFGIVPATAQTLATTESRPPVGIRPPTTAPQIDIADISVVHRIVNNLINWAFIFFFTIAIAFILMAAFSYLTAGDKGAEVGKKRIQIAITAIIIALLARGLPALIQSIIAPPPAL